MWPTEQHTSRSQRSAVDQAECAKASNEGVDKLHGAVVVDEDWLSHLEAARNED